LRVEQVTFKREQNEHVNLLMSGPLFNKNRNSQNYSGNGNASDKASSCGAQKPEGIALQEVGF
jgi:hypothetical protein